MSKILKADTRPSSDIGLKATARQKLDESRRQGAPTEKM
jgi:hypothetical protein